MVLYFAGGSRGRGDSEGRKELSLSRGRAQLDRDLEIIDRLKTGPQTTRAGGRATGGVGFFVQDRWDG